MAYVVDFRSDTVTKPCADMRKAMFEAEVGDDVWGDDPTVKKLEETMAKMLKKDAALFVPSGTMSNLLAILAHCQGRGEEVLLGDQSHIMLYEQGGIAQFAGVNPRTLVNKPDGTFDLQDAKSKIRMEDIHYPRTRAICIENTHNAAGGKVVPIEFIQKVRELADSHSLQVHLDGARIMNAAVAMDVTPDTIAQYCDSVSVCLSKGLGAPVGSCLVGSKEFIKRAHRHRKALGGGMRQVGILAAAGLVALEKGIPRLKTDHENAKLLAQGVIDLKCPSVTCDLAATETNMVYLMMGEGVSAKLFYLLCGTVTEGEEQELGQGIQVQLCPVSDTCLRVAIHHHITAEHIAMALKKIAYVDKLFQSGEAAKHLPKN
ncbi:probable low-specificity L-threonine aldolase 1 [Patiria miniata]|uniref:Aromatic amino acid beta-eliminating lyase/threonine aldolase domain-containing protein n=1 Tax=Patiria miniata TaxID=46514 RepID=A0A914AUZ5_PATMI|nr:probable low-specificity L-threonine aldolase 1 [Patiria miniata]